MILNRMDRIWEGEEDKKNRNKKVRETSLKIENQIKSDHSLLVEIKSDNANMIFENLNWLKTKEAAQYLRTSPKQLRKWVYQGRVKAYKLLGKSLRFKKSELDLLLEGGRTWQ